MSTDEYVPIQCPHCTQKLAISVRFQGGAITCPACKREFPFSGFTAIDLCRARAARLGCRCVNLDEVRIGPAMLRHVSEEIARKELIVPVAVEGDTLTVAVSELHVEGAAERLRFILNRPVSLALAPEDSLRAAIERCYGRPAAPAAAPAAASSAPERSIDFVELQAESAVKAEPAAPPSIDAAAAQRLQRIISEAFRMGASQALILPIDGRVKVAYRIHDVVCLREDLPSESYHPVLMRLMTMVNLHGLMKVSLGGKERRLQMAFRAARGGISALIEIPQEASLTAACKAHAAKLGYRFVDLADREIPKAVLRLAPEALWRELQIVPVAIDDGTLMIAFHDPRSLEQLERLRFVLNRPIGVQMATEGAILAALDRCFGHADGELSDLLLWEMAQGAPAASAPTVTAERMFKRLDAEPNSLAKATLDQLRLMYHPPAFALFDKLRATPPLCRRDSASGRLEVVFPQAHLLPHLPDEARQYLDDKVWALREAIITRLVDLLEKEPVVRGIAMSIGQYDAGCRHVEGALARFDPALAREACVNFLYAFALHAFPTIETNGALVNLVTQRLGDLRAKIVGLLDDPNLAVDAQAARDGLVQLGQQTSPDESLDSDAPQVARLVDLIIAEALHVRASRIVLVPDRERIEAAWRVQCADVPRPDLPLALLRPVLDRLAQLEDAPAELAAAVGLGGRSLRVGFRLTAHGPAALVRISPDPAEVERTRELAAKHGCEMVDLEDVYVPSSLLALAPKGVAWRHAVLPLAVQGNAITLAVCEPPQRRRLDELRLIFNRSLQIVMAPRDEIHAAIYRHYMPTATKGVSPAVAALLQEETVRTPVAESSPAPPLAPRPAARAQRSGVSG